MNPYVPETDGSYHYYDSDFPSYDDVQRDPAMQAIAWRQGILHDIPYYAALAEELAPAARQEQEGGEAPPIVELACGTGRLTIPLARAGFRMVGVDVSSAMLEGFRRRLSAETPQTQDRLTLLQHNLLELDLPRADHELILWPYNGLMLIADFDSQINALRTIRQFLRPDGRLALDIANPLMLQLGDQTTPEASYTRINRRTGNLYTKFAMVSGLSASQTQRVHGWYDEIMPGGAVRRTPYGFEWRAVFRYELELMLTQAGYGVEKVEGGFLGENFDAHSPKIVVTARNLGATQRD
jgi:SAM-dependent methyltransferase